MVYPALLPLMCTSRLPVDDWTDAPADLNWLVRFAERRNLVSARVPSHFKHSLTHLVVYPRGGETFRVRPDRSWGPPSLLYNESRIFLGGKAAGACYYQPPSSAEVFNGLEINTSASHLCLHRHVTEWPLPVLSHSSFNENLFMKHDSMYGSSLR
jgi:hypothetical protein